MMGQWDLKHVGFDVWKHYRNSNEVCEFVGLHCYDKIIIHRMANVKFYKRTCSLFKRKVQLRTHTSATLCQVGIWNFADVLERYMVNTVTPSESQIPGWALITLFPENILPTHILNSTPKCISSAICDGLLETKNNHGKTVLPTRSILVNGRGSKYLFCKGNSPRS